MASVESTRQRCPQRFAVSLLRLARCGRAEPLGKMPILPRVPSGEYLLKDALLHCDGDGLGAALHAEFAQDAADVELDRRAADHQPLGDLGIV